MQTVEEYWLEFERHGFQKKALSCGFRYTISPEIGEGYFDILGNPETCFFTYSDILLYKPLTVLESVQEKMMELGQLYTGEISYYQKKNELFPVESGLNYWVNYPIRLAGYKRIDAGERLLNTGICYRAKFFETLPHALPEDFWETATAVLNPDVVDLPAVSGICDQIRSCRLQGTALALYAQGKCLEAFAWTLQYIYAHRTAPDLRLDTRDRAGLEQVKTLLQRDMCSPLPLQGLAAAIGMNQKKMMRGFKQLNGITINRYLQRMRMEKALELLRESDASIIEIAQSVGYHGDGHFQQVFKSIYGITPGKLRRELSADAGNDCGKQEKKMTG